jgi:hypothetical protein
MPAGPRLQPTVLRIFKMTRKFGVSIALLVFAVVLTVVSAAGPPERSITLPEIVPMPGGELERYSGGYVLRYTRHSRGPEEARIHMLRLSDRSWRVVNPWPEEPTASLVIKKVVALKDGRVVIGLRAISWDNQRAEVVAVFDLEGKLLHRIRTNPYAWDDLAVDKDESLWIFAYCPDYLESSCGSEYSLVRQYALDGSELASFLPAHSFPPGALRQPKNEADAILLSRDGVGVYSGAAREWILLDRNGQLLHRQRLPLPEEGTDFRFAMTESGRLLTGCSGCSELLEWRPEEKRFVPQAHLSGYLHGVEEGEVILARHILGKETTLEFYRFP